MSNKKGKDNSLGKLRQLNKKYLDFIKSNCDIKFIEGGRSMKHFYAVEFTTTDGKKHTVFSDGQDELEAIDKVAEEVKKQGREILDIKVLKGE